MFNFINGIIIVMGAGVIGGIEVIFSAVVLIIINNIGSTVGNSINVFLFFFIYNIFYFFIGIKVVVFF